jgi:hypothetical protein
MGGVHVRRGWAEHKRLQPDLLGRGPRMLRSAQRQWRQAAPQRSRLHGPALGTSETLLRARKRMRTAPANVCHGILASKSGARIERTGLRRRRRIPYSAPRSYRTSIRDRPHTMMIAMKSCLTSSLRQPTDRRLDTNSR